MFNKNIENNKQNINPETYYTVKEAADLLDASITWVNSRCNAFDPEKEQSLEDAIPYVMSKKEGHRHQKQKLIEGKTIMKILEKF